MDEIELLRRVRADQAEPSFSAVQHGRDALLERAAQARGAKPLSPRTSAQRAKLRRGFGWGLAGVTGVVVVTGALVLSNLVALNRGDQVGQAPVVASESPASGSTTGEASTVESVLTEAAAKARLAQDPVLAEGQYLLMETEFEVAMWEEGTNVSSTSSPVAWMVAGTSKTLSPSDEAADSFSLTSVNRVAETFGPESEAAAAKWLEAQPAEFDPSTMVWPFNAKAVEGNSIYPATPTGYAELPGDPESLFDYYTSELDSASPQYDAECLRALKRQFMGSYVPAEVRADLFEAMLLIPSIKVVEGAVDVKGVSVAVLGVEDTVSLFREEILIDATTGDYLGFRTVYTVADSGLPAGHVKESQFAGFKVVDGRPF